MKRTLFVAVNTLVIAALVVTYLGSVPGLAAIYVNPNNAEINSTDAEWQLTVTGLVEHSLNLSWAEIVAMPQTIVNAQLICVDLPTRAVQGNWTGVKLRFLLEKAIISPQATKVGFFAKDDYSTDLTMEAAMRDDIILACAKDDEPLTEVLRLVAPGKWGYKWIGQVVRVELFDYDFKGFWESRGYSDEAEIIRARITEVSQIPIENNVLPGDEVKVNATVTDNLRGVKRVALNYTSGNGTWVIVEMANLEGNVWKSTIPSFPYGTNVTYVILAEDNAGYTVTSEEFGYEYQYQVIPEFLSFLILPLFIISTLLVAIVYRKKYAI